MIDQQLDPRFAETLRDGLVSHVRASRRRRTRRRRVVPAMVAVAALLVGGSIAFADRDPSAVDQPLARPIITTHVGSAVVPLPPAPAGATHLRYVLDCMTPGRCMTPDGGTVESGGWAEFTTTANIGTLRLTDAPDPKDPQVLPPLDPAEGLRVTAASDVVWRLYAVYVDEWWGDSVSFTNHAGQTYGLPGWEIPDLIAVWTDDGRLGYTPAAELLGDAATPSFRDDADVRAFIDAAPVVQQLPVYTEDGTTLIGQASIT